MFQFIEKHVEGCLAAALLAAFVLAGVAFVQEHDARIKADVTVQAAQTQISDLQKQKDAADAAAQKQITALQKQAKTVKTPAQAVQAIPPLTDVPLNMRQAPGLPDAVTVDALPLFQQLNECKQDAVNLSACSTKLDLEQKIDADKDVQITALKKKPGFWTRVKDTAITVGIGVAAGYVLHR